MKFPNRNIPAGHDKNYIVDPFNLPTKTYNDFDLSNDMDKLLGHSKWRSHLTPTSKKPRYKSISTAYEVVPDFRAQFFGGEEEYIDVKFTSALEDKSVRDRIERTRTYLASKGIRYRVVTDAEIRRNQLLIQHLNFFKAWRERDSDITRELREAVPKKPITLGALAKKLESMPMVLTMIANQLVFCDFEKPISDETILRPIGGDDHAMLY